MEPLTGGCHYDGGCGRYRARCGACPVLGSNREKDLSRTVWHEKTKVLAALPHQRLRMVADSQWMNRCARESSLFGRFKVQTIHYGLDTTVFAPRDRSAARAVFGVPDNAFVLLFAAEGVANPRKGFQVLAEALSLVATECPNLYLLSLGTGSTPQLPAGMRLLHRHLGAFSDDRLLASFYSAGDLFVIPSLQEAFGQTALEAMACGSPVVGFDTGGIPDMITGGHTGLLARAGDAKDLAAQIRWIAEHLEERAAMGRAARAFVQEDFSLLTQARHYHELYCSCLGLS